MSQALFCMWFLFLVVCVWGQTSPASKTEQSAIQRVKNMLVSSFDRSLPKVSLEFFLKSEGEGAPIGWRVNDCGKPTGKPKADQERVFGKCVIVDMELENGRAVTVLISVGTFKSGLVGSPALFSVTITDPTGFIRQVPHLSDLPAELHRPQRKGPRDLPLPVGTL
jgi:hypothetical protein